MSITATFLSADTDLNQDPANFGWRVNDASTGVALSYGLGVPANSPSTVHAAWSCKVQMSAGVASAGAVWTGVQTFSNMEGEWTRNFARQYSNGSASFDPWTNTNLWSYHIR